VTTIRPALDAAARLAVAARTEAALRRAGAVRTGHFQLEDGRHGEAAVEPAQVLRDPAATSELCGFFAARGRGGDGETLVSLVVGASTGGAILAFETARQLGVGSAVAGEGLQFERGERVLLVDDILTTGRSLRSVLPVVEAAGGEIVECLVLVDRSDGRATLASPSSGRSYPLRSLWLPVSPTYEPGPATCPQCADGTPLEAAATSRAGRLASAAAAR
jgi:orotate phosphoribosyltransferase